MKRILLTSASIVAFAGAAAADGHTGVSFDGDAEIGYNDEFNDGVFWSLGLSLSGAMELDNGLTASIEGDVELDNIAALVIDDVNGDGIIQDDEVSLEQTDRTYDGNDVNIDDLVISLSSDTASLAFGDTAPAADKLWSSVGNMDADSFNDEGDHGDIEDAVLIGEATFGSVDVGVSYFVFDTNGGDTDDDLDVLQLGAAGDVGAFSFSFGYQEDNSDLGGNGEVFGLSASTSLGGADVSFGYAAEDVDGVSSLGLEVAYPVSDVVTVTVFYVLQDDDAGDLDDNYGVEFDYGSGPLGIVAYFHDGNDEELAVEATYDVGNGLSVFGGYLDEGETGAGLDGSSYFYLGGDYDLGGGANLRVSFADVDEGPGDDLTRDELGQAEDVKDGFTIALDLDF